MARRVSHSLLDPLMIPLVPRLYRLLPIPRAFPPEGIVVVGHLLAIVGAVGFALAVKAWWGGLLAAVGVAGNHLADMVDGTHARATGQCRNGGELLDHFFDPLSFAGWAIGLGVCVNRLDLALVGVIAIYATSVLTNIKAKITGRFTLAAIGPTEFKAIFALGGLGMLVLAWTVSQEVRFRTVLAFFTVMVAVGIVQLGVGLVAAVVEVNRAAAPADTTSWQLRTDRRDEDDGQSQ
jgi:phosphatidylglycerophosphate synthase